METHRLRFPSPAAEWTEALPLGNGRLGLMAFGDPDRDRFAINDDTAWSGSPRSEFAGGRIGRAEAARALAEARAALDMDDPVAADTAVRRLQQRYTQAYLPFGDLVLEGDCAERGSSTRELDLRTATHVMDAPGRIRRSSFVSAVDSVAVIDSTFAEPGNCRIRVTSPLDVLGLVRQPLGLELRVRLPADVAPTHEEVEEPVRYDDDPRASLRGVIALDVRTDGRLEHDEQGITVTGARRITIVLATATTFRGIGLEPGTDLDDAVAVARRALLRVAEAPVEELARRHRADHAALYDRVDLVLEPGAPNRDEASATLDLPARLDAARASAGHPLIADPSLAALLFHYGRYLLIASSRPGTLPATLQGIWNESMQPPWSSNYTVNINAQMNYWGAESTALPELHEPLFDLIEAMSVRGAEVATRLYGARGWAAHHNSDAWAYVSPVGLGRANPSWAFWPMAAPWLVRHFADHLDHGAEEAFAARALPIVRGAAEFLLDWFELDETTGRLGTPLSTSPENDFLVADGAMLPEGAAAGTAAVGSSSALDLELARDVLTLLVSLSSRLGVGADPVVQEAVLALERLPAPSIAPDGGIAEWADGRVARDPHHRHVSMLYGLYPGDRPWTSNEERAASRSLDLRGDEAAGWSLAWKALLRARLRQPDRLQDLLALVFRDARQSRGPWSGGLYPNLFAAHPPFQIDGNLGFIAVVAESIVQSHRGEIELLPALPSSFSTGSVRGLIARPGVSVDVSWTGGSLDRAVVTSPTDREVSVRYGPSVVIARLRADVPHRLSVDAFANRT